MLPKSLSSNASGNGYSDPNVMIPQIIESVRVDGGAFNVREEITRFNFAECPGSASASRSSFLMEMASWIGWSTANHTKFRVFEIGRHQITFVALAYYRFS